MNERIDKLAKQAAEYANEVFEYHGKDYREIVMEKFAELIVLESSKWIIDNAGSINELGPEYFAMALCKHFGVEE
jgi:hypothetical protein